MTIQGAAVANEAAGASATGAEEALPAADRLAALFDAHQERLFRLALRMLGDRQAALDLVQETFLRALASLESVPGREPGAGAWLSRVAINLARDHWRRRGVRQRWAQSARAEFGRLEHDHAPADRLAVREALGELSPRQRAVVLMSEVEGMNSGEIARQLGLRPVTVRWHLATARRRLRERLGAAEPVDSGGAR